MQYLLTEDEYTELVDNGKAEVNEIRKKLQTACTLVANHIPVNHGEYSPDSPNECLLPTNGVYAGTEVVCDKCLVQQICPYEYKEWSQ